MIGNRTVQKYLIEGKVGPIASSCLYLKWVGSYQEAVPTSARRGMVARCIMSVVFVEAS